MEYSQSTCPIYKSFNALSWEHQTNFGGRVIATKAGVAGKSETRQERVTLKFKDEDAEAIMAKASRIPKSYQGHQQYQHRLWEAQTAEELRAQRQGRSRVAQERGRRC